MSIKTEHLMRVATNRDAVKKISELKPFTNSGKSFWAKECDRTPDTGRMPVEYVVELKRYAGTATAGLYVIFSYDTPIAYVSLVSGEAVIPDVKYSPTTSRHQALARQGLRGR